MARRGAVVVGVVVALAVVAGLALWGPTQGGQRSDRSDLRSVRLRAALGRPAGVVSLAVGSGRDLHGYPYVATVVSLAASATPAQVVHVVESMPGATRRAGLPGDANQRRLTFLTPGGSRLTIAWQPRTTARRLLRSVTTWLAVAAALRDRADVSASALTGGGIDVRIGLGPVGTGRQVLDAYRTAVAAGGDGSGVDWLVSATAARTALTLEAQGPLDPTQRRAWASLLRATGRLGRPLGSARLDVAFGDRVEADLALLAPPGMTETGFTPRAYGDAVRPAVGRQLRTISRLTTHWTYHLSWVRAEGAPLHSLALLYGDQGTVLDDSGSASAPTSGRWADRLRRWRGGRVAARGSPADR